jgi:hypothetical protein
LKLKSRTLKIEEKSAKTKDFHTLLQLDEDDVEFINGLKVKADVQAAKSKEFKSANGIFVIIIYIIIYFNISIRKIA